MPSPPDPDADSEMMARVGKPVPVAAREAARLHCKEMGLSDEEARECVQFVAHQLEQGKLEAAQAAATRLLDLTGACRVVAVLLAGVQGPPGP